MNLAQTFNPWIAGIVVALTALISACATVPPELAHARKSYDDAQRSQAVKYAPADLREAKQALIAAERAFDDAGNDEITRTLAYRALRKTQTAMVKADIFLARQEAEQSRKQLFAESERARENLATQLQQRETELKEREDLAAMTMAELANERARLDQIQKEFEKERTEGQLTAQELAQRQQELAVARTELEQARKQREEMEQRLEKTREQLAKIAQIKEDARRMVITLNGSVLFEVGESNLLPTAQRKLDQVVEMLVATRDTTIVVEGHTDSQGSDEFNRDLSQRRADAVRSYLVSQGVANDRIEAIGRGEERPIATNDNASGRANNRRVEIIVDKQPGAESATLDADRASRNAND